ncbi:hypothetical protein AT728_23390 [Streptomyces silvensis]|uniref:DUF317 domain-containing protein n=1 Tax=Streptomyces silvensis TaxID=1765722 RepID=A0A0W7X217_9ACTN|nr:hypothetical protein AT728_23390 [Streptomyces silvensis]
MWFATQPRYLAGRGDPRHITQALRAGGWKNISDADLPQVALVSPDHLYSLLLEPEPEPYTMWWTLNGRRPEQAWGWTARFSSHTPVEILAALTDTLLQPEPDTAPEIWPLLTGAGWTHEHDERGDEIARHPDGILCLRQWHTGTHGRYFWTVETPLPGYRNVWNATLDDVIPQHLLAAFVSALALDEPVQRAMYDVPHTHLVRHEQRGPQGAELAAARKARLATARSLARKARRKAAPPTTQNGPPPAVRAAALPPRPSAAPTAGRGR